MITCWSTCNSRSKAGRKDISYRKYKPLRNDQQQMKDDSIHAAAALEQNNLNRMSDNGAATTSSKSNECVTSRNTKKRGATKKYRTIYANKTKHGNQSNLNPLLVNGDSYFRELNVSQHSIASNPNSKPDAGSSSGSSTDEEDELIMTDAPADKDYTKGTWFTR